LVASLRLVIGIQSLPSLTRASERYRLATLLRKEEFVVRQHCCEYFIRFAGQFICVLVLFPSKNEAQIYKVGLNETVEEAVEKVMQIVKCVAPDTEIQIHLLLRK